MRYLTIKSMSHEKLDDRSRSAIYNDVEAGRLPKPIKLGGKNYFIEQEVDEYLIALREKDEWAAPCKIPPPGVALSRG